MGREHHWNHDQFVVRRPVSQDESSNSTIAVANAIAVIEANEDVCLEEALKTRAKKRKQEEVPANVEEEEDELTDEEKKRITDAIKPERQAKLEFDAANLEHMCFEEEKVCL
jgi:hypothetical protein